MSNEFKNGYVRWSVFMMIVAFAVTILGFIWQRLENIDKDITEIKVDSAITRADVNNLISRILSKEITFKVNGK